MKKYSYLSIFVFSVLLLSSCYSTQDYSQETTKLNEFLKTINQPIISKQKEVYVFATVNTGCHSCYESVLDYAKHKNTEALHYIFSSQGIKMLNATINDKAISAKDVILDGKFLAKSMNLIPNTAIAYLTSNAKIITVLDINTANIDDVFDTIKEHIER